MVTLGVLSASGWRRVLPDERRPVLHVRRRRRTIDYRSGSAVAVPARGSGPAVPNAELEPDRFHANRMDETVVLGSGALLRLPGHRRRAAHAGLRTTLQPVVA